jgi:cell division protein FtsB
MRIFALAMAALLGLLQFRLWVSDQGMRDVWRLKAAIEAQQAENSDLTKRNEQLAAEVVDLKQGMAALEERARSELGMVGANETFYQVVTPAVAPAASASPVVTAEAR